MGYAYDGASRLTDLALDPPGSGYELWTDLDYNPAGQIVSRTTDNSAYLYSLPSAYNDTYESDGLNRYSSARGGTPTYDGHGNMTSDGLQLCL